MNINEWSNTIIEEIHPEVQGLVELQDGELPLVSCYFSAESWYVISTRRLTGLYCGDLKEIDVLDIASERFGNFKGLSNKKTEVLTITTIGNSEVKFEYETGKASMAPIYAISTLVPKLKKSQNKKMQSTQKDE